jgi:hypothetical protein
MILIKNQNTEAVPSTAPETPQAAPSLTNAERGNQR